MIIIVIITIIYIAIELVQKLLTYSTFKFSWLETNSSFYLLFLQLLNLKCTYLTKKHSQVLSSMVMKK